MSEGRTLRDFDRWHESLRNYEWLQPVAPGASDLDLLIERHGRFLVFEGKHWQPKGVKVTLGQHIALTALSHLEAFTVYLVGESPEDEETPYRFVRYETWSPLTAVGGVLFPPSIFEPASEDDLRQLVRLWMASCP